MEHADNPAEQRCRKAPGATVMLRQSNVLDPASQAQSAQQMQAEAPAGEGPLGAMGRAGRKRVEEHFSWRAVARQTLDFYRQLANAGNV
jgi:glycosyltransferase involved in cell wall biosynthesis